MAKSKNVDLLIKTLQRIGEKRFCSEVFTVAKLEETSRGIILKYEKNYGELNKIVVVEGKYVLIKARGDIEYDLKLIEGETTKSGFNFEDSFSYFSVETKKIFYNYSEGRGHIFLDYSMGIGVGLKFFSVIDITIG